MAFEPGGYADKFGNRHEGRWVVRQLLHLLYERIRSVTIESIGDDEEGVDLWIEHLDGAREAQQCKARNGSQEYWSVADLNSRGILDKMIFQLDRDPRHRFALVTGISATVFGDICDSARRSNGNAQDFYQHQISSRGQEVRKAFRQFCGYLDLNHEEAEDLVVAFNYLRCTYIHTWTDDMGNWEQVLTLAGLLATGDPGHIVASLAQFAEENLRKPLTSELVRQHLAGDGFPPRLLSHDDRVAPAVEELQIQFKESIEPNLVAGDLIPRQETNQILDALHQDAFVILHGSAGHGKSGVLYELTRLLREQGHPYLPIRLDRKVPRDNTKQFGTGLGLPDSPSLCLESLIGDKFGVLILDQLDALRWTSQHSMNSLDVCKSLVREVMTLRAQGTQIRVVLACRTFDLEHDPEISNWLRKPVGQEWRKIPVKGLVENEVKTLVEKYGPSYSNMTVRQKKIIQSPQHLGMWVKLAQTGHRPSFQTSIELLEEFWRNRYREFEKSGLPTERATAVLELIVDHMERENRLYAPSRIVASYPKEIDILCSGGVLQKAERKISFAHQSYLDYLIARRLLDNIDQGEGDVRGWLGEKEQQSLFRREQLRQVLLLLSVESPRTFLSTIQEILTAPDVRFHMKHLVLEVVGEVEEPDSALQRYLLSLFEDEYWNTHVFETVLLRQPHHVRWILEKGIVEEWLQSDDPQDNNRGLWLLQSVNEALSTEVAQTLDPYVELNNEWAERVLRCIGRRVEADSDEMFELRLKLTRKRLVTWIHWQQFAATQPIRAIQMVEAVISTWEKDDDGVGVKTQQHARREEWGEEEIRSLKDAAVQHPDLTWDLLLPHVERLTTGGVERYALRTWDRGYVFTNNSRVGIAHGVVQLLIAAGEALVKKDVDSFLLQMRPLHGTTSPVIRLILAEVYAELPPQVADEGIQWLMNDPAHVSLGSGYMEPKWMPAVRLVQSLSGHCSDSVFAELESFIVHHHEPDELWQAEYYLKHWKEGYREAYWGQAQYFLLPALCPARRSKKCNELIQVLNRKFDGYSRDSFLKSGSIGGGWVGSTLPSDRLEYISDRAWLAIISNEKVLVDSGRKWTQVDADHVVESSVSAFSRDLQDVTSRFPERFGQLALKFPDDVHPSYVAAIIGGVSLTEPPQNISDEEKSTWQPATYSTVEGVLERFCSHDDAATATAFCRLMRQRADEPWSATAIDRLVNYAVSHPDLESAQLNVDCDKTPDEASVDTLFQNSINCVRGVAAHAVAALLRRHPDMAPQLQPAIDSLLVDPHPAVRMAAIELSIATLDTDKDQAVAWFVIAAQDDLRVAACPRAVIVRNFTSHTHHSELAPLVKQMLFSVHEEVVIQGASEVTARWLFHDLYEEEVKECLHGTAAQRQGGAKVAASFIKERKYANKCRTILEELFDDSETEVLQEVSHAFRDPAVLSIPGADSLVLKYTDSAAYQYAPSPLLYILERHVGSLIPYADLLFSICDVFAGPLREQSRDISTGVAADAHSIPSLILRLYEQAQKIQDNDIVNRCLDAWDQLFEKRVGMTRDLAKSMVQ